MGKLIRRMGIPTFAVSALLLVVLIAAYVMGQSLPVLFTDILRRVGMNGILVLAMVPSIKSWSWAPTSHCLSAEPAGCSPSCAACSWTLWAGAS